MTAVECAWIAQRGCMRNMSWLCEVVAQTWLFQNKVGMPVHSVQRSLRYRASDISRKKSKISWDFQGQIRGKIGRFRGIFAGKKSKFAQKSADFEGFSQEKVKIRRKIGRFRGILAEKSQISKDFRGKF